MENDQLSDLITHIQVDFTMFNSWKIKKNDSRVIIFKKCWKMTYFRA